MTRFTQSIGSDLLLLAAVALVSAIAGMNAETIGNLILSYMDLG